MFNLLDLIKESLKDTHIEDGTKLAFDKTCIKLSEAISASAVYAKGVKDGREQFKAELKELLGVKECECKDD